MSKWKYKLELQYYDQAPIVFDIDESIVHRLSDLFLRTPRIIVLKADMFGAIGSRQFYTLSNDNSIRELFSHIKFILKEDT